MSRSTRTSPRPAALAVLAALFGLALLLVPRAAESQQRIPVPQYHDRTRCGYAAPYRLPPRVELQADLDGDGTPEHYIANAGGVELHVVQPGSVPPSLVLRSRVYTTGANPRYACVDLRASDLDGDGDLDLIYGSPAELVVLTNEGGRLRVTRREPQSFEATADVRIRIRGRQVSLQTR